MVAADSRRARTMPPRSPPMRRMPGLSMAMVLPWPCRDRRRPAPAQLRRLDAALSACGGCQPGSGGPRWGPSEDGGEGSRPCPPVHPAQARGSRRHARWLRPVDARCGIAGVMATTLGLPLVSVPVLSTGKRVARSSRSRASASLISTPDCAPRPTATMMDIGVARPSAPGGKSGGGAARSYRLLRWSMPSSAATPPSRGAR